jgi:hypothetical protein
MVMLLRICHVHPQSDRDPELEQPKRCGGRVLSSSDVCRAVFSPSVRKSRNLGTYLGRKLMKLNSFEWPGACISSCGSDGAQLDYPCTGCLHQPDLSQAMAEH